MKIIRIKKFLGLGAIATFELGLISLTIAHPKRRGQGFFTN